MTDLISKAKVLRCLKESSEQIDWGQSEDGDAFKHYVGATYRTIAEFEPEQPQWISVNDGMPETRHVVLVYTPQHKNIWAASMHEDGNWYTWSSHGRVYLDPDWHGPITHWMPLPEPPEEVMQDE